jgi:AcrR family transcriptional regulator
MLTLSTIKQHNNDSVPSRRSQPRLPKTKPYHHGNLRRALLDAALEIIAQKGLPALTLRAAASKAGVSHAAPKRHFPTVTDLYCGVAEDGYRRLREYLLKRSAEQPHATSLQSLATLGIAYVEFAIANRGRFSAMFDSLVIDRGTAHPLEAAAGAAFDVLVNAISRCQDASEVRAGPARQLALGAWAMVHGLAILAVDHQLANRGFSSEDPIVLAREVTQQLYVGLRPSL